MSTIKETLKLVQINIEEQTIESMKNVLDALYMLDDYYFIQYEHFRHNVIDVIRRFSHYEELNYQFGLLASKIYIACYENTTSIDSQEDAHDSEFLNEFIYGSMDN